MEKVGPFQVLSLGSWIVIVCLNHINSIIVLSEEEEEEEDDDNLSMTTNRRSKIPWKVLYPHIRTHVFLIYLFAFEHY